MFVEFFFLVLYFQNDWQNSSSQSFQSKLNADKTVGNLSDSSRRPPPLFGHAMENVPGGFVIFGGMSPGSNFQLI